MGHAQPATATLQERCHWVWLGEHRQRKNAELGQRSHAALALRRFDQGRRRPKADMRRLFAFQQAGPTRLFKSSRRPDRD